MKFEWTGVSSMTLSVIHVDNGSESFDSQCDNHSQQRKGGSGVNPETGLEVLERGV